MGRILHYEQIVEYRNKRCVVLRLPTGIGLLPIARNECLGEGVGKVKSVTIDELINDTTDVENELPISGGRVV